ncbi:hypothetical protein [Turicimonas muris]|nr:hypothetical protein [Turicimonas muris]
MLGQVKCVDGRVSLTETEIGAPPFKDCHDIAQETDYLAMTFAVMWSST